MKIENWKLRIAAVGLGLLGLIGGNAFAQLTATVQPGYQFATGEVPTTGTLNALGQPTITISGTVSGSVGLSAGSVNGTILADSVPDGVTLNYNGSSPRQLQIKPSGVNSNQLAFQAVQGTNIANATLTCTNIANAGVYGTNLNWAPATASGATPTYSGVASMGSYTQTLTGNATFTFANFVSGQQFVIVLVQDGTGSRTVTWPAGIKWRGGAAPTLTTTPNHADVVSFVNIGGTFYGGYSLNYF